MVAGTKKSWVKKKLFEGWVTISHHEDYFYVKYHFDDKENNILMYLWSWQSIEKLIQDYFMQIMYSFLR